MEAHLSLFKSRLHRMGALREEDWLRVESKLEVRTLLAGQLLTGLGAGEYCFLFVCKGLIREMDVNNFGELSISRYLETGSVFIGIDPDSRVRLEALQDGLVLLLSERDVLKLESEHWTFRRLFRRFLIQYIRDLRLRGDILSGKTAEIKYQRFYHKLKVVSELQPLTEQGVYLNMNKDTVCKQKAGFTPEGN